jgi:hypothetical protein
MKTTLGYYLVLDEQGKPYLEPIPRDEHEEPLNRSVLRYFKPSIEVKSYANSI